jgi:hypothetical protein
MSSVPVIKSIAIKSPSTAGQHFKILPRRAVSMAQTLWRTTEETQDFHASRMESDPSRDIASGDLAATNPLDRSHCGDDDGCDGCITPPLVQDAVMPKNKIVSGASLRFAAARLESAATSRCKWDPPNSPARGSSLFAVSRLQNSLSPQKQNLFKALRDVHNVPEDQCLKSHLSISSILRTELAGEEQSCVIQVSSAAESIAPLSGLTKMQGKSSFSTIPDSTPTRSIVCAPATSPCTTALLGLPLFGRTQESPILRQYLSANSISPQISSSFETSVGPSGGGVSAWESTCQDWSSLQMISEETWKDAMGEDDCSGHPCNPQDFSTPGSYCNKCREKNCQHADDNTRVEKTKVAYCQLFFLRCICQQTSDV